MGAVFQVWWFIDHSAIQRSFCGKCNIYSCSLCHVCGFFNDQNSQSVFPFSKNCTMCRKNQLAPYCTKSHMTLSRSALQPLAWIAAAFQPPPLGERVYQWAVWCLFWWKKVARRTLYLWHLSERYQQAGSPCFSVGQRLLTTGIFVAWLLLAVDASVMHRKSRAKSRRALFIHSIGETPLVTMVNNSGNQVWFFFSFSKEKEREKITNVQG